MRRLICLLFIAILLIPVVSAEVTTITIGNEVLLKEVDRLGLNLSGDNYWSGAAFTKVRKTLNFEGTMYRQITFGPEGIDGNGYMTWFPIRGEWLKLYQGASFTIISGPSKGVKGKIKKVEKKSFMHKGSSKELNYLVFDTPVKASSFANEGIMIERDMTHVGQFIPHDNYWNPKTNSLVTDDIDPSTFGKAALLMQGSSGSTHIRLSSHTQNHGDLKGIWKVRFHAKTKSGNPVVTFKADGGVRTKTVSPVSINSEWKKYEQEIEITEVKSDTTRMTMVIKVTGGDMLIDDVELIEGRNINPTAFRDDLIATLKKLKPGTLRYLQMGGSTIKNTINPPIKSFNYQSSRLGIKLDGYGARTSQDSYGLHQFYTLCEHINTQPWFSLPGTMHEDEMTYFMEYLAGDSSTAGGKHRIELGHKKPWTETFKKIHIEFGNEAWNNAPHFSQGGYNKAGYWTELIDKGKKSSLYTKKLIFHAGAQAANPNATKGIMKATPNADAYTLAPYIIHGIDNSQLDEMKTEDAFFRWALSTPVWSTTANDGTMVKQYEITSKNKHDLSVYEINHHITAGDAPLDIRNKLVDGIGGATNVLNAMLLQMKHQKIRTQCLFNATGNYKIKLKDNPKANVHLWGTILSLDTKKGPRYRPTFLTTQMANGVISGDLVQTRHSSNEPTFSAHGIYTRGEAPRTIENIPSLYSYAFKTKTGTGLILVNLDIKKSQSVKIQQGKNNQEKAKRQTLTGKGFTANNEFETGKAQVSIIEDSVDVNAEISIPPHSVMTLQW